MNKIIGIIPSHSDAEKIIQELHNIGIEHEQIGLLTSRMTLENMFEKVPEEGPSKGGAGAALGAVTAGAAGFAGGLASVTATSFFVPVIGPLVGAGLALATLLGVSGAALGAAAGYAFGRAFTEQTPHNELYVYEFVLRHGGFILFVSPHDAEEAEKVRRTLAHAKIESIENVREQWWLEIRETEEAAYATSDEEFKQVERIYREGFEAALDSRLQGKSYEEALSLLHEYYPAAYAEEPFRRGYERGQVYRLSLEERYKHEVESYPASNS